jgi:hypothetical protein
LNEWRVQEAKNKTRKAKEQMMHTPQQIYDCAIFELTIRGFDIQSGWRGAYEMQREYMRRDLLTARSQATVPKNGAFGVKVIFAENKNYL